MQLCEYGCGKPAEYQFKNGKWCCSSHFTKCSVIKNKNSISSTGKKASIETKQKLINSHKGQIPWNKGIKTNTIPWNKGIKNCFTKEALEKISNGNKKSKSHLGRPLTENHKRKLSEAHKGKKISIEHKKNIGLALIGKKRSKIFCENMSKIHKGKIVSEKSKKKMSNSRKGKTPWNKNKIGIWSKEQLKNNKILNQITINLLKERYPTFYKIEEMRYELGKEKQKIIQVHCKNHKCLNSKEQSGWFTPTYNQLYERIRQIEKGNGGSYLYCSDECKEECPLYKKTVNQLIKEDQIAAGLIEDPWYTSVEYQIWRQQVFMLDDSKCVWCGKPAEHAHHILPQKTHPELSLDPENGVSCCRECHYKYGHRDRWCTTGYLSKLVCERIIRIKNKQLEHI